VHGDFKPDNVLIDAARSPDGTTGRTRVADFGLARAQAHAGAESGAIVGTPAYLAPELRIGARSDARSDQYAFCLSLVELFEGARPFATDAHATQHRRVLPRSLRRIAMRGLAEDPERRWPSMTALVDALVRAPFRRRRAVTVAAALVAGPVLVLGSMSRDPCGDGADRFAEVWGSSEHTAIADSFVATDLPFAERAAERVALGIDAYGEAWIRSHRDACEATRVRGEQSAARMDARMLCLDHRRAHVDALVEVLAGADAATVVAADSALADLPDIATCDDATASAGSLVPAERERIAAAEHALAQARTLVLARRLDDADAAVDRARRDLEGLDARATESEADLVAALALRERSRFADERELLLRARLAAEASAADEVKLAIELELAIVANDGLMDFGEARAVLADAEATWIRLGRPAETEHELLAIESAVLVFEDRVADALARLERAHSLAVVHAPEEAPVLLGRIGVLEANAGRYDQAIGHLDAAVAETSEQLGEDHPAVTLLRLRRAGVLASRHDWVDAEHELREIIEQLRATLGPDHPHVASAGMRLANALAARGDLVGAIALDHEVIAALETTVGPRHKVLADAISTLATHLRSSGDPAGALAQNDRALEILRSLFDERSLPVARARANRGNALFDLGRLDEADVDLRASLAVHETILGREHAAVANAVEGVGNVARMRGDLDEAEALLRRALAIRERVLGRDHPLVRITLGNLDEVAKDRERRE
jgi:tetratricopeptide (TPR) repeat protein